MTFNQRTLRHSLALPSTRTSGALLLARELKMKMRGALQKTHNKLNQQAITTATAPTEKRHRSKGNSRKVRR